jgi:hypothetical protein
LVSCLAFNLLQPPENPAITSREASATMRLRENEDARCMNMLDPLLLSSARRAGVPRPEPDSVEFAKAKQHRFARLFNAPGPIGE